MTLDDRARVASDGHVAPVCLSCGQIGETKTKFVLRELLGTDDEGLQHQETCRICDGPIQRINTTYCYSNLLVRELATVGIKVEHKFDGPSGPLKGPLNGPAKAAAGPALSMEDHLATALGEMMRDD